MSLRLRHILLRVETDGGLYGASIPFSDGLVILRADNTSGKSTVVQSFVYALGLEGMLSASQEVPLPHVMTDNVQDGQRQLKVIASEVAIEIENGAGERVVVTRAVKAGRGRNLMTVTFGPALTTTGQRFQTRDYFVRLPGAATREAGFHHWLATWIGWNLPVVARFDGTECPLYMECIFPLTIIEQKRGWAGIQARMPVHYRIRDVGKRAVEFLLALDVYDTTLQRQRLKEEVDRVRLEWRRVAAEVDALIAPANGVVQALPKEPIPSWPPKPAPAPVISRDSAWIPLREAEQQDRQRLTDLEKKEIPRVQQISEFATQSLSEAETDLGETEFAVAQLFDELQMERGQLNGLESRVEALEEDIRRNKDVRQLRKMGSSDNLDVKDGTCPTCHQPIADSLMPVEGRQEPMTIDDNIAFLESQLETFRAVKSSSTAVIVAKERRLSALRAHADDARAIIRSLKETLVAEGQEPSVAAIEERIRLRQSIKLLRHVDDQLSDLMERFTTLAEDWQTVQRKIEQLPKGDLSADDEQKLGELQRLFIEQARQYGVTSLPPESLAISRESYKPIHDGFELEFDLSASDMIRVIWAYIHGLLELSRIKRTNHLGLVIMDEPGQQQMKRVSLRQLIARTASAIRSKQQVILATSEEEQNLRSELAGVAHTYLTFQGFIIKKLA
ncbi:MAG: hypothetical protein JWN24_705 [Phycisphaerales bacterium]|nr:hypothetical protein [Phycisphaerales bacterium]